MSVWGEQRKNMAEEEEERWTCLCVFQFLKLNLSSDWHHVSPVRAGGNIESCTDLAMNANVTLSNMWKSRNDAAGSDIIFYILYIHRPKLGPNAARLLTFGQRSSPEIRTTMCKCVTVMMLIIIKPLSPREMQRVPLRTKCRPCQVSPVSSAPFHPEQHVAATRRPGDH